MKDIANNIEERGATSFSKYGKKHKKGGFETGIRIINTDGNSENSRPASTNETLTLP